MAALAATEAVSPAPGATSTEVVPPAISQAEP
eukprot:CAMPEP_0115321228 /NCGR_PEP_ID=MMETSP0270-20121206/80749_1 /TAXON_ID=71861 /ORGANISM="Scrippsiella trochoidea, Strain CCMP3099" /LENGTH=31 /DNA_ID= /DNA_START= /DNA_END= /DNA_ORIENTATION=